MKRNKLLLLLVLLMTAATGAWAQTTYTVVGSNSDMFGSAWDADATANDMTKNGDGTYSITYTNVYLDGDVQYKVVENRDWSNAYPDADRVINITEAGTYTLTIHFNPTTHEVYETKPGYTVSLKVGTKDAGNWSIVPKEGLSEGDQVTIQYTGRLKVKGVKATSEAAPAEASVPDGALSGKFSVSDGKQVYFSKGNLRYASSKWSFFDNQYDYYTSYSADAWDHFGWSTSATDYGMNTSAANSDYSGDFVDWGATMGTGWRTLTSDEWTYLFNTRSASTVNGTENGRYAKAKVNNVGGIILFPDTYTHPDGVTAPTGVNETGNTGWNGNSYTAEDWTKMETAGCVFLPAAGYRNGSRVNNPGSFGDYSSATPYGTDKTYGVFFGSGNLTPASEGSRFYGLSVRLVSEVTTSEAAPAGPAPITLTAKLAYTGGEIADFTDATDDLTTMTWAVGEHIAILYEVSGTKKVADAEITAVDGTTGAATITFTVEEGTPDNTACTLVYPYDAAKDDHTGVKDAATLLAAQDGTLSANLDVRVGAGTIQTTTPGLTVTTQPEAQFAIFKFTTKSVPDEDGSLQNTNMTELTVTIGAQDYVITPASATSTLYAALPAVDGQTVSFTATDGSNLYAASKASVSFDAAKYYQSTVKMGKVIEVLSEQDMNKFVGPNPPYHYLHIGLDQAYAIAKQLSAQNSGATVAVVYNHAKMDVTYALSSDASATAHTNMFVHLFDPYHYHVFLATLWEER